MAENKVPPWYGNTKVERTQETTLRPLVDWVEVTFKNFDSYKKMLQFLALDPDDFQALEYGLDGYIKAKKFGGIRVLYGGKEEQMKIIFTGQGCREYESLNLYDWSTFFALLMNCENYKINRLDLALDDFSNHFTIETIKRKVKQAAVKSRFRSAREIRKTSLADGTSLGDTVYFGSPKSDLQIRFYDKKLERQDKNLDVIEESWVRTEIQLRRQLALSTAIVIAYESDSIGTVISRILKNYVNFLVPNKKDTNKRRWKVCSWWEKFLGDVTPLQLSQKAPDRTIQRSYDWLKDDVAPTMAMMFELFEGDMTIFYDLIYQGTTRLSKKHEMMINQFIKHFGDQSYKDFKQKKNDDRPGSSHDNE